MLRNPAEVVFSTYLKRQEYGRIENTFDSAIQGSTDLVDLGFYHRLLSPYFELFPREHIHVGIYEAFFSDPAENCAALYRFLGVDDSFRASVLDRRVNPRREVRSQLVVSIRHYLRGLLNSRPLLPIKRLLTRNDFLDRLSERTIELNLKEGSPPKLLPETKDWLMAHYDSDMTRLQELLEMDLGIWRKSGSQGSD
jgi:hypothetical protein